MRFRRAFSSSSCFSRLISEGISPQYVKPFVRRLKNDGNVPPTIYAKLNDPAKLRDGSLELTRGSAPGPVASPSLQSSNDRLALLPTG